jgi:hypothetical protein
MKKVLMACLVLAATHINGQVNYSGTYGYSFKPQGDPPKTEANRGPAGKLVLQKMDGNKYRFWLDVTKGWPDYGVGETDGTITIVNDTASFDNTFENATNPCFLKFRVDENMVRIHSFSNSFNCGFGAGVTADGEYAKMKQPSINNDWLKKEYYDAPKVMVMDGKAELFQDETAMHPFVPKRYLMKGETVLSISETDNMVYTEYIPAPGKFMYGWLKKSAVKVVPN